MVDSIPSNRLPLQEILNSGIFPSYFDDCYIFLVALLSHESLIEKFQFVINNIEEISILPLNAIELLYPFLEQFLEKKQIQSKVMNLIEPLILKFGTRKSQILLVPHITNLFDIEDTELQEYLLTTTCFSFLQKNLGLEYVLELFPHLFEALRITSNLSSIAEQTIKHFGTILPLSLIVQRVIYPLFNQIHKVDNTDTIMGLLLHFVQRVGPSVVETHYIPSIMRLIQTHSTRAAKGESVVLSALGLIEGLLPHLPSKAGMNNRID